MKRCRNQDLYKSPKITSPGFINWSRFVPPELIRLPYRSHLSHLQEPKTLLGQWRCSICGFNIQSMKWHPPDLQLASLYLQSQDQACHYIPEGAAKNKDSQSNNGQSWFNLMYNWIFFMKRFWKRKRTAILMCLYCKVRRLICVGCAVRTISTACDREKTCVIKRMPDQKNFYM